MRVTGSGDPRQPVEKTIPGKLPQRKITTTAAAGYSLTVTRSGVASGLVAEVYDEGFVAKRMEMGAVIGARPGPMWSGNGRCRGRRDFAGRPDRPDGWGATGSSGPIRRNPFIPAGLRCKRAIPPGTEDPAALPPAGSDPLD